MRCRVQDYIPPLRYFSVFPVLSIDLNLLIIFIELLAYNRASVHQFYCHGDFDHDAYDLSGDVHLLGTEDDVVW
jgi:hypothetical protein